MELVGAVKSQPHQGRLRELRHFGSAGSSAVPIPTGNTHSVQSQAHSWAQASGFRGDELCGHVPVWFERGWRLLWVP